MTRVDPGEETIELHRKKIKKKIKVQFLINSMLKKIKLKQNSIKKEKNPSQPN
jgi:hypothetical protein